MSNGKTTSSSTWLVGGGEMGKVILAKDWSQTPLGPMESWPSSLRTTVSLALNSNFPISLAWGPQHTQIYNDGYWPICGDKHPHSMGQDFSQCWASAFPVIGDAFRSALAGTTAYLEDQRMFLDRHGYLEETFFTFSFSPICDENGEIAGLFHPVTETSSKMLNQRRTRTLRDIAALELNVLSIDAALQQVANALGDSEFDVPFALFYKVDDNGKTATLVAQTGMLADSPASPSVINFADLNSGWPFAEVATTLTSVLLQDLNQRFDELIYGPYPEPIQAALVYPILLAGQDKLSCIMVTGVSSRLPLTEAYRSFFDLLAAAVTTVITNATAFAAERKRADALAEIDRAKMVFFSNVSHEFRTPLTLLLGPLEDELAEREEALPPARHSRLETVYRNGLRLLKLVNTLLDFARIEAGRVQAVFEATDLAALTTDLAGNFRSACEQAGLGFTVECKPLPQPVYVDRDMWEKIVLNLLSNAFKFTLAGGIQVCLEAIDDNVKLTVRDTGSGIPEDELPKIFDRFHRVKGVSGRTHEGTGIGLALIKELVGLHGGVIQAESTLGQGSLFSVIIPFNTARSAVVTRSKTQPEHSTVLGARPFVEEALRWQPAVTNTAPVFSGVKPRIVWADDNADMREYVLRLLSEQYDVEAVADGEAALAAVHRNPPTLVLSDVMMPKLDGFGLLRELRNDKKLHRVPVILLSARAGEEARIEGLEVGADDYLTKPFSARELLARVSAHIELAQLRLRSEREQLDEIVSENERKFRLLAEAMPQIVWIADPGGQNTFFNQHWTKYTGLTLEESYGHGWIKPFHPEDQKRAWEAWRKTIEHGAIYSLECRLRRADGAYRWWLIRGVPVTKDNGEIEQWFGTCTDIDELKQMWVRLNKVMDSTPNAIVMVSTEGDIEMVNAQVESIFNYSREELLGQPVETLIPQRFRDNHPALRNAFFFDPQARLMGKGRDLYALRKDGTELPVEIKLNSVEVDGSPKVLAAIVDISSRKLKEQKIEAALEEKNILLSEIHHRVKNNLQIVHSLLNLQSSRITDKLALEMLSDSQNRIRSMALIHQTLYQSNDFSKVNFNTVLDSLVPALAGSYRVGKNIQITIHATDVFLPLNLAIPCGLVVNELVTNALKHAFPNGKAGSISIELSQEGDNATLSVSDTGVGFTEEFDFEQTKSLGIQLVSLLADQLSAELTINRSGPTRFTLLFALT